MTDTPNQPSAPTPVNQKLIVCPACSGDILARVYVTVAAGTNAAVSDNSFTVEIVGLSIAHDCSPKVSRGSGLT